MEEALCVCVGLPPQPVSAFITFYIKQQTHMHKHLMHGDRNMMRHSCVSLLSFFAVVSSRSVPTASLYGSVAAQPDYTLNLQPPQETHQDIEASLDVVQQCCLHPSRHSRRQNGHQGAVPNGHVLSSCGILMICVCSRYPSVPRRGTVRG